MRFTSLPLCALRLFFFLCGPLHHSHFVPLQQMKRKLTEETALLRSLLAVNLSKRISLAEAASHSLCLRWLGFPFFSTFSPGPLPFPHPFAPAFRPHPFSHPPPFGLLSLFLTLRFTPSSPPLLPSLSLSHPFSLPASSSAFCLWPLLTIIQHPQTESTRKSKPSSARGQAHRVVEG